MLHQVGLYVHMVALIIVGGGSIGSVIIENQLWKRVQMHSPDAKVMLPALKSAKSFVMAGLVLFLASGVIMLGAVHFVYFSQPWFIAKFFLFLLLPMRGAIVAKPVMMQIGFHISQEDMDLTKLMKLKKRMDRFHLVQYILVVLILFLVIFKI